MFFSVKYALALSIKTVPNKITPKKNLTQKIPTSNNNNPLVIKVTNNAPKIVPKTVTEGSIFNRFKSWFGYDQEEEEED